MAWTLQWHSGGTLALALAMAVLPSPVFGAEVEQLQGQRENGGRAQSVAEQREGIREAVRQRLEARREQRQARNPSEPDAAPTFRGEQRGRGAGAERQRSQIEQRLRERGMIARQLEERAATERNRSYADEARNTTYMDRQRARDEDRGQSGVDRQRERIDSRLRDFGVDRRTGEGDAYWRERRERAERERRYRNGHFRGDHHHAGRRYRGNHYYDDYRVWNRYGWRNDRRYDWYRYRAANRHLFRPGRYYSPYYGSRYNRLHLGVQLGRSFYNERYWINDPWRYRLPDVYGPYRWVRYYDDVLLVDIYSGEVVDVIYDFFW